MVQLEITGEPALMEMRGVYGELQLMLQWSTVGDGPSIPMYTPFRFAYWMIDAVVVELLDGPGPPELMNMGALMTLFGYVKLLIIEA